MATPPARNGRTLRAYQRKAARLRRASRVCWLCGEPIDLALDYRHAMSWTADHTVPLARGGHVMGEIRPAHRRCNSSRGTERARQRQPVSRDW